MDGTTPEESASGSGLNQQMAKLRTTESSTSMDSVQTVTTRDGPVEIDPETFAKYQQFCQMQEKEKEKTKRKREKSGSQNQKPKRKRALLSPELDKIYKLARNAMGRQYKFQAQIAALKKYTNMEGHMVPPTHQVSLCRSFPTPSPPTYTKLKLFSHIYDSNTSHIPSCTYRSGTQFPAVWRIKSIFNATKTALWLVKQNSWRLSWITQKECIISTKPPVKKLSLNCRPNWVQITTTSTRKTSLLPKPARNPTVSESMRNKRNNGQRPSLAKRPQPLVLNAGPRIQLQGNHVATPLTHNKPAPQAGRPRTMGDNTCAHSAAYQVTTVHVDAPKRPPPETMQIRTLRPSHKQSTSPYLLCVNNSSPQYTCIDTCHNNSNNNNNSDNSDSHNITQSSDPVVNTLCINELDENGIRNALCKCTNHNLSNHVAIKFFDKTKFVCLNNKDDRCVINLSSHNLNESERSVLSKGLTFCPTPGEPNIQDIKRDLKDFFRRLKLRAHYFEEDPLPDTNQPTLDSYLATPGPSSQVDVSKFKPKSFWEPKSDKVDPAIETFCRAVMNEMKDFTPMCPRTNNLSKEENEALFKLVSDKTLEIKKADKGSATVIMDMKDYIEEAHRQLSDTEHYVKLSENPTQKHSEQIRDFLLHLAENDEIDWETYATLDPINCRTARFYFLPKIHKKLVVGRPIISGNGCPTEQISAFVDEHIKRYVSMVPSYVRDTTDFINKLRRLKTDKNKVRVLVTMDVSALYTNIPNNEGKTAVYRTLIENNYDGRLSIDSIMTLLNFVLQKNNFEFYDEHYLQIGGTSMGTKVAPSLANLFMANLEKKLLKNAPCQPDLYLRFIDDIFCVFSASITEIENFIEYMNSSHHSIKFTAEISQEEVTFLDTKVKIDPETKEIYTELYTKDTDTQNYLSFDSCHPKHCKTGGPFGEFLRIRRNCHKLEDYDKHSEQRVRDYQRRGYPTELLEESRQKARALDRNDLLKTKDKTKSKKDDRVPLIITHNPANPNMRAIIDKHWHLLQLCSKKEAFQEKPLISFRRNKNLSDYLVRAKCSRQEDRPRQNPNIHPCSTPWYCKYCPKKSGGKQTFRSTTTRRTYSSPPYTCNTRNVIYLITCSLCNKQYVGETHRSFKERMKEHEGYVKNKRFSEITGVHYNQRGHRLGHMNFEVIYCLWKKPEPQDPVRIQKEIRWMEQLKTFKPTGLNVKGR